MILNLQKLCTALHCTAPHCSTLPLHCFAIALHCIAIALHCPELPCTTLLCPALHCSALPFLTLILPFFTLFWPSILPVLFCPFFSFELLLLLGTGRAKGPTIQPDQTQGQALEFEAA